MVLVISIMYRGCALPVAWAIVPAAGLSWHPFLRINRGDALFPACDDQYALTNNVSAPWLIVTDLPPNKLTSFDFL